MRYLVLLTALAACTCSPMHYNPAYPGVPNLDRVDDNIYRSGQITTDAGWDTIAKLAGTRRIHVLKLNFENEGSDAIAVVRGYDVQFFAIQPEGDTDAWDEFKGIFVEPDRHEVDAAEAELAKARDTEATDFYLIHCTHGQDRTGFITGKHRVDHDGWTKEEAWNEMLAHHFHTEIIGLLRAWEDV